MFQRYVAARLRVVDLSLCVDRCGLSVAEGLQPGIIPLDAGAQVAFHRRRYLSETDVNRRLIEQGLP